MTIDEAITHAREEAKEQRSHIGTWDEEYSKRCEECAEEHEQLAEWLEELKELRKIKEDYAKGMQTSYATFMYNKAIDDFYNALADDLTWLIGFGDEVYISVGDNVRIRAEQLKAGGNDEMEK